MKDRMFKLGLVGGVVAAVCCFSPLLVWMLPAIGLGSLLAYMDIVLFPLLMAFSAIALLGLQKRRNG